MDRITSVLNETIIQLAYNNAIYIPDFLNDNSDNPQKIFEDLDFINDLHFDSLLLITMVVEIETALGIEFPDDLLAYDIIRSYKSLCDAVLFLCKKEG